MRDSALQSKLRRRFAQFCSKELAPHGFERRGFLAHRDLTDLRQAISLQLDKRGPERYTVNIYWHLLVTPHESNNDWLSMDGSWRIGTLAGGRDRWFTAFVSATFEREFAEAARLILEYGVPHLQRFESVQDIVTAVDEGVLTRAKAFGPAAGWQRSKLAYCAAYLGDYDRALDELRELFSEPTSVYRYPGKELLEQLERGERPRIVPAVPPVVKKRSVPQKAEPAKPAGRRSVIRRRGSLVKRG